MAEISNETSSKFLLILGAIVVGVGSIAALSLLLAFPVKWTWNHTMPSIFGLIEITVGQAWCLAFLTSSLFKSTLKCQH